MFAVVVVAVCFAARCVTAGAMNGVHGDIYEEHGSADYFKDRCNACNYLLDAVDEELRKKPLGYVRGTTTNKAKAAAIDYEFSETRAYEILEAGPCKDTFGATKKKCDEYLEANEEDLVAYIRGGRFKTPEGRVAMCATSCAVDKKGKRNREL